MSDSLKPAPTLALVVPCYNESEGFKACVDELKRILADLQEKGKISPESYALFVDDGSRDDTWNQIKEASLVSPALIKGLKLSRNYGHQTALIAGLTASTADATISLDADLQDDVNCIEEMVDQFRAGFDIVYGVRNDRTTDSFFKRFTANSYYGFMSFLGVKQVPNHADYRLLSKRALKGFLDYKERNMYIRGVIPLIGFPSTKVYYKRLERVAGESKYPLHKMLALAMEGITSLSIAPLRWITFIGFLTCLGALAGFILAFTTKFFGVTITGWTSLIGSIFFLSGVQLLSLGIIGEYVGKIYMETKQRPLFFVDETTDEE